MINVINLNFQATFTIEGILLEIHDFEMDNVVETH